jgi:hypothetical protein
MRLRPFLSLLVVLLGCMPPALAQQGDPSFNLLNRSGQAINEIYVSPVREQFWGRDLLGTEILPDGRSFPVRIAPSAGCQHDVRVVYADGRNEERRNQNTCTITEMAFGTAGVPNAGLPNSGAPGSATPPGSASTGANPSFNLVNQGRLPIREFYVSSARDTHWGLDRLGTEVLPVGRHFEVRLPVGECVYDVRVVWMDSRQEERRAIDTCQMVNLVFR